MHTNNEPQISANLQYMIWCTVSDDNKLKLILKLTTLNKKLNISLTFSDCNAIQDYSQCTQ